VNRSAHRAPVIPVLAVVLGLPNGSPRTIRADATDVFGDAVAADAPAVVLGVDGLRGLRAWVLALGTAVDPRRCRAVTTPSDMPDPCRRCGRAEGDRVPTAHPQNMPGQRQISPDRRAPGRTDRPTTPRRAAAHSPRRRRPRSPRILLCAPIKIRILLHHSFASMARIRRRTWRALCGWRASRFRGGCRRRSSTVKTSPVK
jgi:hypothetical protein